MPIYFLLLFLNTILRDTKDTLLVTLSSSGVQAIPFLKTWLVIPGSVLYFFFYSYLSKKYPPFQVFQILIYCFNFFYLSFALLIFPATAGSFGAFQQEFVSSENKKQNLHVYTVLNEWPLAAFFIISELWASGACQVLFWQTANSVVTAVRARAIYPSIGAMGNLGMVVAGQVLHNLADERDYILTAKTFLRIPHHSAAMRDDRDSINAKSELLIESWTQSLLVVSSIMFFCSCLVLWLLHVLQVRIKKSKEILQEHVPETVEEGKHKKYDANKKASLSFKQSLMTLFNNTALRACAILVVSYGVSSCLLEVTWKAEVKRNFPEANDYSRYMASFWFYTGIISMFFMFLGRLILPIEKYGYKVAILFTPTVEIIGGIFFFISSFFYFGNSAHAGAFLVMMGKSSKYAFFDTSKEILFISLTEEARTIGKAAIEVVCYRLAKSGGSFYLQGVIFFAGTVNSKEGLILIAIIFFTICALWVKVSLEAANMVVN